MKILAYPASRLLNLRFRHQIIIIFTFGIFLLSTLVSYSVGRTANTILKNQMLAQGQQLSQTLADQTKLALLYQSEYAAADTIGAMEGYPGLEILQLISADGNILHRNSSEEPPEAIEIPATAEPRKIRTVEHENRWVFSVPVYSNSNFDEDYSDIYLDNPDVNELLGYLTVSLSKETLHLLQQQTYKNSFIASLLIAILLIFLIIQVSRRIIKPIEQLAKAMGNAQEGNTAVRARIDGQPDVAKMQHAFNTMMEGIEQREEDLRDAHDQALETARLKGDFVANVTHELRTPLNAVLGMMDLLSETRLNNRQAEYIDIAKNSGENLLSLIENILDFSKMESGKVEVNTEAVALHELAEEVIQLLTTQALTKKLNFGYDIDPLLSSVPIVIDKGRTRQVLINLIGNAIKFTDTGEVFLRISHSKNENGSTVVFNVQDTGIGIKPKDQKSIFDAFTQADLSTTKAYTGTGLGLTISKQLVELMGGEISVSSTPGKGTAFQFTIPIKESPDITSPNASFDEQEQALLVTGSTIIQLFTSSACQSNNILCVNTSGFESAKNEIAKIHESGARFKFILVDEEAYYLHESDFLALLRDRQTSDTGVGLLVNPYRPLKLERHPFLTLEKPLLRGSFDQLIHLSNNCGSLSGTQETIRSRLEDSALTGLHALVVDDNRINQQVAQEMLGKLGNKSDAAIHGKEAVLKAQRKNYDFILMDCNMPVMDGYEATREIRQLLHNQTIPIIAMSANVSSDDQEKCIAAGMNYFLPKPLRFQALRDQLAIIFPDASGDADHPAPAEDSEISNPEEHPLTYNSATLELLFESLGDVVIKMLEAFFEDTPIYIGSLKQGLIEGNAKNVRDLAHTIKGSASNFGMTNFVETAKIIEHLAENGQLPQCNVYVQALLEDFNILKRDIDKNVLNPASIAENIDKLKHKILIVDDDRSTRLALKNIFTEQHYLIFEARNGKQAIEFCNHDTPSIILMDAVMPDVDGVEACRQIRALPSFGDVPILMITSLDDDSAISRAFSVGATDYITKPLHFTVLKERVSRLIQANRVEKRVKELAYHDPLTSLPNRTKLMQDLRLIINRAKLDKSSFAVLFLDLDHFKNINDSLGHNIGDMLLKAVADRLLSCVRDTDLIARLGGDEFTIVLENIEGRDTVEKIANNICNTISEPFVFIQQKMFVTSSIGISVYPDDGDDINELIKHADLAMFRAKTNRNDFCFYQEGMADQVTRRMALEQELRHAISHNELVLYFQPQFDLTDNKIRAAETLIRWQHPDHGLIGPGEFIPLAEECGLIKDITFWVIRQSCQFISDWARQGHHVTLSVNLSARDMETPGSLTGFLAKQIDLYGISASQIELEITESLLMADPEKSRKELLTMKEMGFVLAIDDFGTGYSSLNYLKNLPVDNLKIDRSFIADLEKNQQDKAIVKGIIALAESLSLGTIAEGIENEKQSSIVRGLGCNIIQGYFIDAPVKKSIFEEKYLKEMVRSKPRRRRASTKKLSSSEDKGTGESRR